MFPYFINLNNRLISEETTSEVRDFAFTNIDKFINRTMDGNYFFGSANILNNVTSINELLNKFKIRTNVSLICQLPRTEVIKHKDNSLSRNTVLIIPINPLDNYPPSYFWNLLDDTTPIEICSFENNSAVLFNTQKIHSVVNNSNEYRLNLQFSFYENIETIYKLYSSGQLLED